MTVCSMRPVWRKFLSREAVSEYLSDIIAISLDGAGWHKSHALRVPDNITLVHLPPYAPELNPVELLWRQLRQRYLSNRVYAHVQELDQALGEAWMRLSEDPQRIRQLTNFDWIEAAVASHQRCRENLETS